MRSKAIETLAKLDVFDINDVDKNYVLSILNFANANEEAVRATTDNRKETILTYNNYKEHGFVPSKNGKYFYMWDEQINTETNNVYVAAQWLSKVSTPLNVRVLSTHSSKVTYSWNAVSGVTNYEVYYSINGGAPVTVRVKELAYTIPGLENGDEVYIIDTGKNYIYDASSSSLIEKKPITGLPSGGVSGQVLGKTGIEDDDVEWITLSQEIQAIGFATDANGILNVTVTNS